MSNQEAFDFDTLMKALMWLEKAEESREPGLCADMARHFLVTYDPEHWPSLYTAVLDGIAEVERAG